MTLLWTNLGEFRLGEPRLAHLWRLAHVVALRQRPLGEGLGAQVLAGLAAAHMSSMPALHSSIPSTVVPRVPTVSLAAASSPAASSTACLALHTSTTTLDENVRRQLFYSSFKFCWWHWFYNVTLPHLQTARSLVPCTLAEEWGASPGWRGWGCLRKSWGWVLCRSYQSGHGSGNTCSTCVLQQRQIQPSFTWFCVAHVFVFT